MSIVAPIVATSAIVPVICGRASTASGPARCSGSAWSPRWSASIARLAASRAAAPANAAQGAPARAARRARRSASALVFLDKAAEHDALTGVAAARAVAVPVLALLVAAAQRPRAAAARCPQLVGDRPARHRRQHRVRDRHHRRPAQPRRGARRPVPGRHRRARLLPPARAPAAAPARRRDPRARRHPADQRLTQRIHRVLEAAASGSGGDLGDMHATPTLVTSPATTRAGRYLESTTRVPITDRARSDAA